MEGGGDSRKVETDLSHNNAGVTAAKLRLLRHRLKNNAIIVSGLLGFII